MPDTVEELNDLISKLNFLKTNFPYENFPDEGEKRKRQQQFYGKVEAMDVDINSFESIEDAITSAEKLKLKKEKEQERNGKRKRNSKRHRKNKQKKKKENIPNLVKPPTVVKPPTQHSTADLPGSLYLQGS